MQRTTTISSSNSILNALFDDSDNDDNVDNVNEVDAYLSLQAPKLNYDPLDWWKDNLKRFSLLSWIAHKYLLILATSVSSERLFSDAGNILTAKRSKMCPNLFKKLVFLKRNGKHLNSIHGEFNES